MRDLVIRAGDTQTHLLQDDVVSSHAGILVERGATLRHLVACVVPVKGENHGWPVMDSGLRRYDDRAGHQTLHITLERDATYELDYLMAANGVHLNVHIDLKDTGARAQIHGVQLGANDDALGAQVCVTHHAPHCASRQFVRSVLGGAARARFFGKVHVDRAAQKTDGYQLTNTILLTPTARIETRPELEIYADDVKCSHGNTVGRLDAAALFYARQRGLSESEAKRMLLDSFIAEVFAGSAAAQEQFSPLIADWMDAHVGT